MHRIVSTLLAMALAAPGVAAGQAAARPTDVSTLDGILTAYYEVVSGPAGQPRQWGRDSTLHHPDARVAIVSNTRDGRSVPRLMTLGDYHQQSSGLAADGFFEREIKREVLQHGAVAHVWSTYEWRQIADGPVGGRGVNSIQLAWDGTRWWITSWIFDGRSDAPPVPPEYLPAAGPGQR